MPDKAVVVGSSIPHFKLQDQNGVWFDSSSIIGKKPCVIYFYPKNFTPGCTAESCGFRDHYETFKEEGVEVIGISSDSVKSHQKFAAFFKLPFVLLSDPNQEVHKKFGVKTHFFGLLTQRITFIVNQQGLVVQVYQSQLAKGHIQYSLKALKKL